MLALIISLIIAWLAEVGRNAYITDRDRETNFYCDVDRTNLMHHIGYENY